MFIKYLYLKIENSTMEETLSMPSLAYYLYFLSSEEEGIKEAWNNITAAYSLKEERAGQREQLIREISLASATANAPLLLKSFSGSEARAFLFLFKDVAIIEILFFSPWKEQLLKINDMRKAAGEAQFSPLGEAAVIVVDEVDGKFFSEIKGISPDSVHKTELIPCVLFHFVTPGEEMRLYACKPVEAGAAVNFLIREFPLIDSAIQKLMKEMSYFRKQQEWISGERKKIDKGVGEILHRQVVGAKQEREKIGGLEKDLGELSRMYGLLATDAVMLRNAHRTLKEQADSLNEFIKTILKPGGSNGIELLYFRTFWRLLEQFSAEEAHIRNSAKNAKTAIDVVKSKIELVRSEESLALQEQTKKLLSQNIMLQEEGISLQVAAGFIEFIILFYYSLSAWEHLISLERFEHISILARFFSVLAFSTSVVVATHFAAKSYKEGWKLNKGLLLSSLAILGTLGIMIALSL